jgi:hypothetical protein
MVPAGWGSQISRHSAHEDSKVVSPKHRPPLPPREIFLVLIYVRGWVDPRAIVWPEELCQWKIPMTSGIEPATVCFVMRCLNQLRHRIPLSHIYIYTPTFSTPVILFTPTRPWRRNRPCSETSAYKIKTPGNYPEESIQTIDLLVQTIHIFIVSSCVRVQTYMNLNLSFLA